MKPSRVIVAGAAVLAGFAATSIVVAKTAVPAIHHGGFKPAEHHASRSRGGGMAEHRCAHHAPDQGQSGAPDTAPSQPI